MVAALKKFQPPNQNISTPQNDAQKNCLAPRVPMVQVIWYGDFFIITAKNGFVLRNGVKGAILGGGSETGLSKFQH